MNVACSIKIFFRIKKTQKHQNRLPQTKFLLQDVSETDDIWNNFEREQNNNCSNFLIFYLQTFKLVASADFQRCEECSFL